MSQQSSAQDDEGGGIKSYLMIVLVAVVLAIALGIYLVGSSDEILAIVTQSPT